MHVRLLAKTIPMQLCVPVRDLKRADGCDPVTNCIAAASDSGDRSGRRAFGILLFREVARSIALRSRGLPRSRISAMPLSYDYCIFEGVLAQLGGSGPACPTVCFWDGVLHARDARGLATS